MMKRVSMLRIVGVLVFLGVASLTVPRFAHAGGVQVSIGIGLPLPVTVVPAPVVVVPQPVIVHPAPVVIAPLRLGHPHRLPPGIAKKYFGDHPKHKHWKQHRRW